MNSTLEKISSTTTHGDPAPARSRIKFLDVLRGLALLGTLVMNIMEMGQPSLFYFAMDPRHSLTGGNYNAWFYGSLLCEGMMRGLFSLLFGAGTLLLLDRLESKYVNIAADIYYGRTLWLVGFGLLNSFIFLWFGDILYCYGLLALVLYPFRKLSAKQLLTPIFILLAFGVYRESVPIMENQQVIFKGKQAEAVAARHQPLTAEAKSDLEKWQALKKQNDLSSLNTAVTDETDAVNQDQAD